MKKILPPTYLLAAILLVIALHFLLPGATIIPFPWSVAGVLPLAAGIFLNLAADRQFKQASTTVKPFERSTTLVTTGVFRWSRNPMYFGQVLIVAGIAAFVGSVTPWGAVVAFAALLNWVFVVPEERMLTEAFGDAFESYKTEVRRWI